MVTGRFRAAPGPIIERFFGGKDCFFVQVGSNDGVRGDPLHKAIKANPQWRGIFIEPLDDAFSRLTANYANDSRYTFEHVAISDADCEQWFFYVSPVTIQELNLPPFPGAGIDGASSLNLDHVVRNVAGLSYRGIKLEHPPLAYISKKLVRCVTLPSLLAQHRVSNIDLLHIDAETSDFMIIKQLDLKRFRPRIILFEAVGDSHLASKYLSERGYRICDCGTDTIAIG